MTTLEIAARSGVRHDNLLRLVRQELEAVDEAALRFEASYIDRSGKRSLCYCLPGEYLLHVLTAFDAKLRFALIKHWQAVNEGWAKPVKNIANIYAGRLVAGTKEERRLRYQTEIAKVEAAGRRATAWDKMLASKP
ncbi:MAG: hypothetical protein WA980_20570 [Shinella zoogloeoides]|uniref:hypothetical protein n=1 Tax=Shinella zoogloeoides TaxID=352475 RepID=UPI003C78E477